MASESLNELVARLGVSANALAAVGAALDARSSGTALEPALAERIDEVLGALGVTSMAELPTAEVRSLLGQIRTFSLANAKLLFASSRALAWQHDEHELLEAAGDVSSSFPRALAERIAPRLEGLAARLAQPGAAFLDVGVGVAAMAVEMARCFPLLRIVGLDPWPPALELARARVEAAQLTQRIELRQQSGSDLSDEEMFDLVWVAGLFIPEVALVPLLQRVQRALHRGGWLLFPTSIESEDPLANALARLRTVMFGGFVAPPKHIEELLRQVGFVEVSTLPSAPGSLSALTVGRRAR